MIKEATKSFKKKCAYETDLGRMYMGDSLNYLKKMPDSSVDLVITSPPFALVRKKDYGNKSAEDYVNWFSDFGDEVLRVLKDTGSFVIDIGGSWVPGFPTRSTYHYQLLIDLTQPDRFHLAQDFFWLQPSKLPTPAEWVTVRKIRVKDAINTIWWLSKTPFPKASNRRVSLEYSDSMLELFEKGYKAKKRPSGHDISDKFSNNRGGAIPPNFLTIPHTSSNDYYQRKCREKDIAVHPARFPPDLPLYFINMLTDPGDLVVDIFAGSNVTGWICEHVNRQWLSYELDKEYIKGSLFRFDEDCPPPNIEVVGKNAKNKKKMEKIRLLRMTKEPETLSTGEKR